MNNTITLTNKNVNKQGLHSTPVLGIKVKVYCYELLEKIEMIPTAKNKYSNQTWECWYIVAIGKFVVPTKECNCKWQL